MTNFDKQSECSSFDDGLDIVDVDTVDVSSDSGAINEDRLPTT